MTITLVLAPEVATTIRELVELDIETGAVLLGRVVESEHDELRLLVSRVRLVPEGAYAHRDHDRLDITSAGYVHTLREAEMSSMVPIWMHTHPGLNASAKPSEHDRRVDGQLNDLFRLRAESRFYGSAIFARGQTGLRLTALLDDGERTSAIERLLLVGPRFSLQWTEHRLEGALPPLFDRHIRAFGGGIQRVLGDLRVAVVGCGGTGSCVAEQLVRLGVRNFVLVDPDRLSESNVTRVYGSTPRDVGREKVDVIADHLLRIAPDTRVDRVAEVITSETTARRMLGVDAVFGCTDDNAGRLVMSRLATYALLPVIDCGVLLTSNERGDLEGIHGRVTVLHPGAACLVCRDRIDMARAASEMLEPEERARRADEGYAPALLGVEPAVVPYTTLVAATAVGELLERLVAYGPEPAPSETLLRVHERETSSNIQEPRELHYCHADSGKLGLGDTTPFLEQTWHA